MRESILLVKRGCKCSFDALHLKAKHKVHKLDEDQRVKFIRYIVQHHKSFFCSRLEDKAIECNGRAVAGQLFVVFARHLARFNA